MALVGSLVAASRVLVDAPLYTAQALRYAVAAILLVALARRLRVRIVRPRGTEWLWLTGVSATGLVLFNVAVVRGVGHAEPAVIAVAVACAPVLLGVIGPLLQRQSPRWRILLAAVTVTAGAVLVEGVGRTDATGVAWAAVALGCEAGFTLLAVPVLVRHGAWGVSVHSVWIAATMLVVLAVTVDGPVAVMRLSPGQLTATAYLVLVTVVAFLLWYSTVARLGPGPVGLLMGIAPVSAALTGIVTGSRTPHLLVWVGVAVVLAGQALGLRPSARRRRDVEPARSGVVEVDA